ncbi:MAG: hypothetical protein NTW06_01060 [Candidatus Falkowbacteria bacterium]|jgi:hypothetical protein|nr:hypothetical protein [Candidatus Falkowbacteria bacterium]
MKKAIIFAILLLVIVPCLALALPAQAQIDFGLNEAREIGLPGNPDLEPKAAAITIIQYLMTFLGIIAVVVMLWGGFQWLTAGGNESRVESAKKTILAGIIGLIVIVASYAIVTIIIGFAQNIIG